MKSTGQLTGLVFDIEKFAIHDGKVYKNNYWKGDTLELFFSLNKNRPYSQFVVNPSGKTYAAAYLNENGIDFNNMLDDMKTKVVNKVDKKGWTVYIALPMNELIPRKQIKPSTVLYANFFRNSPKWVALSWNPIFQRALPNLNRLGIVNLEK